MIPEPQLLSILRTTSVSIITIVTPIMKGTVSSFQSAAHLIFPSNVISSWVTQDSKAIAAQLEEKLHNLPNSTALDIIITIINEIIIQQGQLEGLAFTICNYVDAKQL